MSRTLVVDSVAWTVTEQDFPILGLGPSEVAIVFENRRGSVRWTKSTRSSLQLLSISELQSLLETAKPV